MRISALIPWLFFGPLMLAMGSYVLWRLTGWAFLPTIIQAALAVLGVVIVVAFIGGWRSARAAKPD